MEGEGREGEGGWKQGGRGLEGGWRGRVFSIAYGLRAATIIGVMGFAIALRRDLRGGEGGLACQRVTQP